MTTIHFPEQCTLTGDDSTAEPLLAALQQLAVTAQALATGGGHRHSAAADAEPVTGGGGHRQAHASHTEQCQSPHERVTQQDTTDIGNVCSSVHTASRLNAARSVGLQHHAAGYDPVWLLLYTVKVLALPFQVIDTDASALGPTFLGCIHHYLFLQPQALISLARNLYMSCRHRAVLYVHFCMAGAASYVSMLCQSSLQACARLATVDTLNLEACYKVFTTQKRT